MKKAMIVLATFALVCIGAKAQVNPHAIGLRLGGNGTTNGAEISYQHGLSESNRLEFDLGFRSRRHFNSMFVAGIYHWNWNLTEGLNWYVGPGAAVGLYNWDNGRSSSSGIDLGVGGQIGLEYNFNSLGAPILLSLDARPMFEVLGYNNGFGWGAALSIRYTW